MSRIQYGKPPSATDGCCFICEGEAAAEWSGGGGSVAVCGRCAIDHLPKLIADAIDLPVMRENHPKSFLKYKKAQHILELAQVSYWKGISARLGRGDDICPLSPPETEDIPNDDRMDLEPVDEIAVTSQSEDSGQQESVSEEFPCVEPIDARKAVDKAAEVAADVIDHADTPRSAAVTLRIAYRWVFLLSTLEIDSEPGIVEAADKLISMTKAGEEIISSEERSRN